MSVSVEERARRKGRAYQCLLCVARSNKETIDVKYRIEDHILKTHLSLDQVPYYCSLCYFKCTEEEDLLKHVKSYRRHRLLVADQPGAEENCLIRNAVPHIIGEQDYRVLSQEESNTYWVKTLAKRQDPLRIARQDPLRVAMEQSIPEAVATQLTPAPTRATTPAAQPQENEATMTSLAHHLQSLSEQTRQLVAASTGGSRTSQWVASVSPAQTQRSEHILEEILGCEETTAAVFATPRRSGPTTATITVPPQLPSVTPKAVSEASSHCSRQERTLSLTLDAIREEGRLTRESLHIIGANNQKCFEAIRESMNSQTEALKDLTRVIKSLTEKQGRDTHGERRRTNENAHTD